MTSVVIIERHGTQITVVNNENLSSEKEMVEDLIAAITIGNSSNDVCNGANLQVMVKEGSPHGNVFLLAVREFSRTR